MESIPLPPDYTIPQGKSAADDRIVTLYKKYQTYFLYDFTNNDFRWNQTGIRQASIKYTLANTEYVSNGLDLISDIWFKFYPEAFLVRKMPYKVFMADSLYFQSSPTSTKTLSYAETGADNIAIGYVGSSLPVRLTPAFKLAYKNRINTAFWTLLLSKKSVELPQSFFEVSSYLNNTSNTLTDADYFKTRGFPISYTSFSYTAVETSKQNDVLQFITMLINTPKATWDSSFLTYPLIKKKYDILTAFILKEYGIDVQAIGNTTY